MFTKNWLKIRFAKITQASSESFLLTRRAWENCWHLCFVRVRARKKPRLVRILPPHRDKKGMAATKDLVSRETYLVHTLPLHDLIWKYVQFLCSIQREKGKHVWHHPCPRSTKTIIWKYLKTLLFRAYKAEAFQLKSKNTENTSDQLKYISNLKYLTLRSHARAEHREKCECLQVASTSILA